MLKEPGTSVEVLKNVLHMKNLVKIPLEVNVLKTV